MEFTSSTSSSPSKASYSTATTDLDESSSLGNKIVSIEGNIGSGKTTLLAHVKESLKNHHNIIFLKEPVDEWASIKDADNNTMLQKFYADQHKYSFSFQMMAFISRYVFLLGVLPFMHIFTHIHTLMIQTYLHRYITHLSFATHALMHNRLTLLRETMKQNPSATIITERSLYTDKMVFAKMLFETGKIEDVNYQIYLKWFDSFAEECPVHQIIYVKTDPAICHERVFKRSRVGEDVIPLEYLQECHKYHENMLDRQSALCVCSNQLVLDGNVDIYDNVDALQQMIEAVTSYI